MKFVFDSSSIISVSETCLIKILEKLSKAIKSEFLISSSVEKECVATPLKIKRFELSAVRIKNALDKGWLKVIHSNAELKRETIEVKNLANTIFLVNNKPLKLVHVGEAESLALVKKIEESVLVVDERTTRLLVENPSSLKNSIERRHKTRVKVDYLKLKSFQQKFKDLNIIRSVDLMALAFEKGLFAEELNETKKALEAALYATKFHGCSVSSKEIDAFVNSL